MSKSGCGRTKVWLQVAWLKSSCSWLLRFNASHSKTRTYCFSSLFFYIAAIVTFLTFKYEHVTFPDYNVSLWAHFPQENFSSWTRLIRLFRLQSALISLPYPLEQGLTFSVKTQVANIFSFADHWVSVAIILVCCHSAKAVTDNRQMNGYGCIPITLYLQRQAVGGFDTLPHLNPALDCKFCERVGAMSITTAFPMLILACNSSINI